MAATVLQHMVRDAGLTPSITIDSAGTHAGAGGKRPDARALHALACRQYEAGRSRSRQITTQDFERSDMVLAMDAINFEALTQRCPPQHRHKLKLFLDFSPDLKVQEVPDPYYGSHAGFERVLDLCEVGAGGLLAHLSIPGNNFDTKLQIAQRQR